MSDIGFPELGTLRARSSASVGLPPRCSRQCAATWFRLLMRYQHVLAWGGLRSALGRELAVPPSVAERDAIVVVTFGVVAFSVFAQGLTMPPLLRRRKLTGANDAEH